MTACNPTYTPIHTRLQIFVGAAMRRTTLSVPCLCLIDAGRRQTPLGNTMPAIFQLLLACCLSFHVGTDNTKELPLISGYSPYQTLVLETRTNVLLDENKSRLRYIIYINKASAMARKHNQVSLFWHMCRLCLYSSSTNYVAMNRNLESCKYSPAGGT